MYPSVTESILDFAGRRYSVTSDDVLWLVRAVEKECLDDGDDADENCVAQALVNCFCLEATKGSYDSLTRFVRAYAQPVNPRWFPDGDLFQRWNARDPAKYKMTDAIARRDKHSVRSDFGVEACNAVDRALIDGPVDIPPNCTDYAAAWIDASRKYEPLTGPRRGLNRLWTRAPGWTGYSIFQWQRSV
jgi:hypothetical protein